MFGKTLSAKTLAKISAAKGTVIFVYEPDGSLVDSYPPPLSAKKTAISFHCSPHTIKEICKNWGGGFFKRTVGIIYICLQPSYYHKNLPS